MGSLATEYCKSKGVDISKIAQVFTLSEERIATTLVSSTDLTRLQTNIDVACHNVNLSKEEQAAMTHVRDKIFSPAGDQSWEGVEIGAYWSTVGKRLMTERLYPPSKCLRTS